MQINYDGPDQGLERVLAALRTEGIHESSRNGPVLRFPEPVLLVNTNPLNRVSVNPHRNANPVFHLIESLWMVAGMNEIEPLLRYNAGMAQYSDDGRTLRGTAYGYKWRSHFGYDQIDLAVRRLRDNPEDRRVVLTMWDPRDEWRNADSKDISCNLQVIFSTRIDHDQRVLDMTVTNRSNDIIYGCLGSNVFHFTFLQEYVANLVGMRVGHYHQFANNLHAYVENEVYKKVESELLWNAPKKEPGPRKWDEKLHTPVKFSAPEHMQMAELRVFLKNGVCEKDGYLWNVARPLVKAYDMFKLKSDGFVIPDEERINMAVLMARQCDDVFLSEAAVSWFERKLRK